MSAVRVQGDGRGRTDAPMGDGLLGNMSSRPRTEIRRDVPAVQQGWVLFDLTLVWDAYRAGTEPDVLTREQLARLDARWQALGLSGATLVIRSRRAQLGIEPVVCLDEELTLNVLLRVRGNLLIHGMPLLDRADPLTSNALLCPDRRLHDHVLTITRPVRGKYPSRPVKPAQPAKAAQPGQPSQPSQPSLRKRSHP
jgi:hypothetical protein